MATTMPTIPTIPTMATIPAIPTIPSMATMPTMPIIPTMTAMPTFPPDFGNSFGNSEEDNVAFAWLLVSLASISTMLGTTCMFCLGDSFINRKSLAVFLGLSSGVMIYVAVAELFGKSEGEFLDDGHSEQLAKLYATLSFFAGAFAMYFLDIITHGFGVDAHGEESNLANFDRIFAKGQDPDKKKDGENLDLMVPENKKDISIDIESSAGKKRLYAMGVKTVIAIMLHNFPEGLASYLSTIADGRTGLGITFGIIMHNIPEGLIVSAPIYAATNDKFKTFLWTAIAGLAELLGGLLGYLLGGGDISHTTYGLLFGIVNGLVTFISVTEFVPMAAKLDPSHGNRWFTTSFLIGGAVIAVTLVGEAW